MKYTLLSSALLAASMIAHAGTVSDARAAAVGTPVTINDAVIISLEDTINSANSKAFHIRDSGPDLLPWENQSSITVFGSNAAIDGLITGLQVGDRISFSGVTGTFNGLTQILGNTANPLTLISSTVAGQTIRSTPVLPSYLADSNPNAELWESNLVRLSSVQFTTSGTFAGSTTYFVNVGNASNQVQIRISRNDMDMIGQNIPTGLVNVVGILSQFDSTDPRTEGYQLLIRSINDITPVTNGTMQGQLQLEGAVRGLRYNDTMTAEVLDGSGNVIQSGINPAFSYGSQVFQLPVNVGSSGYRIRLKSNVHLSAVIPPFSEPAATNVNEVFTMTVPMLTGDVNGDNEVGPTDFAILANAFGEEFGNAGFVSNADLDGNLEIGPADFALLANNFGQEGQ